MKHIKIKNHMNKETIFEGHFENIRKCLEQACADNACLDYADLSGKTLVNANLDGLRMRHARRHPAEQRQAIVFIEFSKHQPCG